MIPSPCEKHRKCSLMSTLHCLTPHCDTNEQKPCKNIETLIVHQRN